MPAHYSSGAPEALPRHRAVVVDDDDTVRSVLGFALRRLGFDVESFPCAREALGFLGRETCRFVLTDLHMPEVDGIQLAHWIGIHRPNVGVAVMSGDEDCARRLIGAAGHSSEIPVLCKPFTVERLDALVCHLLATHEFAASV